jgi:hypothetical protein
MFLDIQASISHIKMRRINQEQNITLIRLESIFHETQQARIEANKLLHFQCPTKSALRKSIVRRTINIRNFIREHLESNFKKELMTARHRDVIQKIQTPVWFSEFDKFVYDECVDLCKLRKIATGIEWHLDHMIPLKGKIASGLHCGLNFQVIPAYINTSKQNKNIMQNPFEWLSFL